MPKTKIAIALDPGILERLDALVDEAGLPSRSQAIEAAIQEKLERVARTVNLFSSAGVPLSRLHFVAVVHGPATSSILDDARHLEKFGVGNPNAPLIAALEKAGVQVVVCGQALAHFKFPDSWVNPQVEITLAAITDIVILQQQGYVLVPL